VARQETEGSRLNRETVIQAALAMLDAVGVDGLSMRALADKLGVKAASLYWHLRDKDQLLELVAESVLEGVTVPAPGSAWRPQVTAVCAELARYLKLHRGAATVVLGSPAVVQRSRLTRDLARLLSAAGLADAEGAATTLVIESAVSAFTEPPAAGRGPGGQAMTLAIDSGSWKVLVRAAKSDTVDIATSTGGGGAASVEVPFRTAHQRHRARQRRRQCDLHAAGPAGCGSHPRQQRHRWSNAAPPGEYRRPCDGGTRFGEGPAR
jgi:AcrR family transcriptional regulator